jgi:hypothetical protein
MTGAAEAQLNELGLRIEEFDFGRSDDPNVKGFASLE